MSGESVTGDASAYARDVVAGRRPLRWSELEARAFGSFPDQLAAITVANGDLAGGSSRERARSFAAFAVMFAPLLLPPIVILAVRFPSAQGWWFAAAAAIALAHTGFRVLEWRRAAGSGPAPTAQEALLAVFEIVFGLIAGIIVVVATIFVAAPGGWLVAAALLVMCIACVVSIVVAKRAASSARTGVVQTSFERSVDSVAHLADAERSAIAAELTEAVDVLASAGVIDGERRAQALEAPLGGLARRMWAIDQAGRNK